MLNPSASHKLYWLQNEALLTAAGRVWVLLKHFPLSSLSVSETLGEILLLKEEGGEAENDLDSKAKGQVQAACVSSKDHSCPGLLGLGRNQQEEAPLYSHLWVTPFLCLRMGTITMADGVLASPWFPW